MLSDDEVDRYARHLVLREVGGIGQAKIRSARVLIVGAVAAFRRFVGRDLARLEPINPLFAGPLVLLVGILVVPSRGGIQNWPLTGSSAYRSAEPFVNQAAQNAAWGFFDSAYRRLYDRTNPFVTLPPAEAPTCKARRGAPLDRPRTTPPPNRSCRPRT